MDAFETLLGPPAPPTPTATSGGRHDEGHDLPDPICGDAATFDEFYAREWVGAVRLATLLTQHSAAAEDIAQDALTRLMARFATLENPSAYLHTALVNECRKWHRRHRLERSKLPLLTQATTLPAGGAELADAVAKLPYRQRAVLVLRYYADLPEATIASALGCRPGTVKSLAARALAQLHKEIER